MAIPYQINPTLGVQLVDQELSKSTPSTHFEYVDVVFNASPNTDTDIVHALGNKDVDWQVVGMQFVIAPAATPCIYRNIAGNARPWGTNYLILRCNVASVSVKMLLTTRREPTT